MSVCENLVAYDSLYFLVGTTTVMPRYLMYRYRVPEDVPGVLLDLEV
jgi:hypothetical protein